MILDGKKLANQIIEQIAEDQIYANVAIIKVGNDPASDVYVRTKTKRFTELGWNYQVINIGSDQFYRKRIIIETIKSLNNNPWVTGIFVQLPVEGLDNFDIYEIANTIDPLKDVDGLGAKSVDGWASNIDQTDQYGKLQFCLPCTPAGIIKLLDHYNISIEGKKVTIIGRSMIVGTPLTMMMTNHNATVTLCHSYTNDLIDYTTNADIVISAVGKPGLITSNMIRTGSVLIDVGISRTENGLVGDFDKQCYSIAGAYTPVPGGVGPMTVAMLCNNVYQCALQQLEDKQEFDD